MLVPLEDGWRRILAYEKGGQFGCSPSFYWFMGSDIIGNEAFAYCKNLRHFNIPETVTDIGEDAFAYCPQFQNEQGLVLIRGVMHSYNGKSSDKLCLDQSINRVSQEALQNLPDIIYREGTVREYSLPDISVLQVGETVMLGRCIQDHTLEMKPIAWRVIAE